MMSLATPSPYINPQFLHQSFSFKINHHVSFFNSYAMLCQRPPSEPLQWTLWRSLPLQSSLKLPQRKNRHHQGLLPAAVLCPSHPHLGGDDAGDCLLLPIGPHSAPGDGSALQRRPERGTGPPGPGSSSGTCSLDWRPWPPVQQQLYCSHTGGL